MKINVDVTKLIEIIDLTTRFVAKNATLPILQNIYLKASIDNLLIRATDMEKYIEVELPCNVGLEWAITVNAKTFSDIIRTIEEKEIEITVDQKTQVMTIKSAKDNFEINGISSSEYVALPDVPESTPIILNTQEFSNGIEKVEFSVTEKNFSPVLTGIHLKTKKEDDGSKLIFVGTDSFRLAEFKLNTVDGNDDFSLIIPKININDIKKIADYAKENECEDIQVKYSDNLVAFEVVVKDIKILATSLLIQGNFPEYDREEVMPRNFNTTIMVDKNLCEKAIKKIGILTRDINNFIQVQTNGDSITISSGKTDKGAGTTHIPAIIEGEQVTFGINGRYISDFIRIMEWDELQFNIVDEQKPLVIQEKANTANKYVVRPLINS